MPRAFRKRFKVFQVVSSISGGIEWKAYIERHIARSNVVLVIIGPQWVSIADSDERRRLDSSADPVRQEIEAVLRLHAPIVPVLVGGAAMPGESQLPESLKRLAVPVMLRGAGMHNSDVEGSSGRP